jgi:hypothetical protein
MPRQSSPLLPLPAKVEWYLLLQLCQQRKNVHYNVRFRTYITIMLMYINIKVVRYNVHYNVHLVIMSMYILNVHYNVHYNVHHEFIMYTIMYIWS